MTRMDLPHDDFIMGTQAFLEAYRKGATVEGCEAAMLAAGYRIVPVRLTGWAALKASAQRWRLKEEAERKADSDRLDALAAQREQRRHKREKR